MVTTYDFIADIIEHPADDTPRLIYADYLEENGQEERGEFIRVQIELAHIGGLHPPADDEDRAIIRRAKALRRRERELLSEHYIGWIKQVHPNGFTSVFRRGFVTAITCSFVDWCGGECPACRGCGRQEGELFAPDYGPCPLCHGTGRTGAHGPALVRAAPLERVTLSDCPVRYFQDSRGRAGYHFNLPTAGTPEEIGDALGIMYDTEQQALDALSAACLAWARSRAAPPRCCAAQLGSG